MYRYKVQTLNREENSVAKGKIAHYDFYHNIIKSFAADPSKYVCIWENYAFPRFEPQFSLISAKESYRNIDYLV